MEVSFDPDKNVQNLELRGLSFERVPEFAFATAWIVKANQREEKRYEQAKAQP